VRIRGFSVKGKAGVGALAWVKRSYSGWMVHYAIPNIAGALARGSRDDESARKRGCTRVADSGRIIPMLPRRYPEVKCKISGGDASPAMVVVTFMDHNLNRLRTPIVSECRAESVVNFEPDDLLGVISKCDSRFERAIDAHDLAQALAERRQREEGCSVIYDTIGGLVRSFEETMPLLGSMSRAEVISRMIFQELMIMSNFSAAAFAARRRSVPCIYSMKPPGFSHGEGECYFSSSPPDKANAYVSLCDPANRYIDLENQRAMLSHLRRSSAHHSRDVLERSCRSIYLSMRNDYISELSQARKRSVTPFSNHSSQAFSARLAKENDRGPDAPEGLSEEISARSKSYSLSELDIYLTLTSGLAGLESAKKDILASMTGKPGMATAFVLMGKQKGLWKDLKIESSKIGSEGMIMHRATATIDSLGISVTGDIKRKASDANRSASLKAVAKYIGLSLEEVKDDPSFSGHRERRSHDPVGMLYEQCVRAGAEPPRFSFAFSSKDGSGTVSSICDVMGVSIKSSPMRSKSKAKAQAASKAISILRSRSEFHNVKEQQEAR